MPWFDWYQSDIPCIFTPHRADENRRFLENAFHSETAALEHPGARDGHLQQLWHSVGAGSFVELNWLAEDLRLLESKPGYSEVLHDIADIRLCRPTWHAVHTAALFERARPGSVIELVVARNDEVPDLIVQIDGDRVPVEAKLLMQSEAERAFSKHAKQLIDSVVSTKIGFPEDALTILVPKRQLSEVDSDSMLTFCEKNLGTYAGLPMEHRSDLCNLFVEPIASEGGVSRYYAVWVMTQVPETEALRVRQRAKKASRQLRSFPTARNSGVIAVGLSDSHVGEEIFDHIGAQVRLGHLSGIAAVLLTKRRTYLGPPIRTTVDLLEVRTNKRATHPITGSIPLRPLNGRAKLSEFEQQMDAIYAWRYGIAGGTVVDAAQAELRLPNVRTLTRAMVA